MMKARLAQFAATFIFLAFPTGEAWAETKPEPAIHGTVASVHPLATDAGMEVLRNGGNAIDAAVAVALTLGVVDGHNSGIGGGCFMLVRRPDGTITALDGREMAPSAATRDMFIREGNADTSLSQSGPLAIGVPGSLAVYDHVLRKFGKVQLPDLLRSAAALAEHGFAIDEGFEERIRDEATALQRYGVTVFFDPSGKSLKAGALLKQPELAQSYRAIADNGIGWFYGGDFARQLGTWMKEHGGILTAEDFRNYKVVEREPVRGTYRGWSIVSFPPPSSGGVHVIQILNMLETFEMGSLSPVKRLHVMAESMKLAFADRAFWLGDPDFVPVPRGLIDPDYARKLAARIRLDRTLEVEKHGEPPDSTTNLFRKHTTHFSVADREGNWVACTTTVNTPFGSKVMIPGTGIILNNQMDDFAIEPGVPNAFGLVGSEANSVAPGKRPLSSMSPTFVLKENEPVYALGAAGGPKIITQTVINLVGLLDLGLSLEQALEQPRIHHQWRPDKLMVEKSLSPELRAALKALGHPLSEMDYAGISVAIGRDLLSGEFRGATDPRIRGKASSY